MMSSSVALPTTGIYEPVAPPRYPVSATNQGAYALIASVIMVAISGLAVFVKLHMTVATFRKLRLDDIALIASLVSLHRPSRLCSVWRAELTTSFQIFALAYTVTLCRSVQHGLGRVAADLNDGQNELLGQVSVHSSTHTLRR